MSDQEQIKILYRKHKENRISHPEFEMLCALLRKTNDEELLVLRKEVDKGFPAKTANIDPKRKQKSLDKIREKISQGNNKNDPLGRKLATVLVIILVGTLLYLLLPKYFVESKFIVGETTDGQRLTIHLSDGSLVKLNSSSWLKYPKELTGSAREVELFGEAFFQLRPTSDVPFIVNCGEVTATVLGTAFNISAYPDHPKVEVAVAHGQVVISHNQGDYEDLVLTANEIAYYDLQNGSVTKTSRDIGDRVAWKDGVLILDGKNLEEVGDLLEKWYGMHVVFEDEQMKKCLVQGRFHSQALHEVLQELRLAHGIDYKWEANKVIFHGKECPEATVEIFHHAPLISLAG